MLLRASELALGRAHYLVSRSPHVAGIHLIGIIVADKLENVIVFVFRNRSLPSRHAGLLSALTAVGPRWWVGGKAHVRVDSR